MGKAKVYNEADAKVVEKLAGVGFPQESISAEIDCCVETMLKLYDKEFRKGQARANGRIAGKLFAKAMEGNTAALIFWAKTHMGWRETAHLELSSPDGTMTPAAPVAFDLSKLTPEEIAKMARAAFRGETQ